MAITVFDARDTFARPRLALPTRNSGAAQRHLPLSVLAAGAVAIIQAVGLLALALQSLDGLLVSSSGAVAITVLLGLAAWIVLSAGSGATLIDGSGRQLMVGVSIAELVLVGMFGLVAVADPMTLPGGLPLPGLLLLAVAVPVGKLLLAGSPSATAWLAAGPRVVETRPDPATAHRGLATVTLGVIGLTLGAVALFTPVEDSAGPGESISTVVYQP